MILPNLPLGDTSSFFSFSSHSRCEVTRAGGKNQLNFFRDFKVSGSNIACAPLLFRFLFVFQLHGCLKSYGWGTTACYPHLTYLRKGLFA